MWASILNSVAAAGAEGSVGWMRVCAEKQRHVSVQETRAAGQQRVITVNRVVCVLAAGGQREGNTPR